MGKYTKQQRRAYIQDNVEQLGRQHGCAIMIAPMIMLISLALFIAWGFGADRMLYVGIGVALLAILVFIRARAVIRRDVESRMDKENSHD